MPQYKMHVISHTHWDREWYLTFQQFRMRLVDLFDHLLDILENEPEFKYFNFDGQTIVLEDYLQIRPEKRGLIEKYVREGRILIGPWYQLNDEFLVSGESTVRSLLIGHRLAQEFGPVMKLGYLPDQFGNIGQMPQILNGFDIDTTIFGRGLEFKSDRKMEFYWESPDGSKTLASHMTYWYNNAQRFPNDTEEALLYTQGILERMSAASNLEHLLLMNGVDHLEAQGEVGEIIARVNEKLKDAKLVHSTLTQYMDAVKESIEKNKLQLQSVKGELREDSGGNILAGTLSSRIYIKQANEKSQTALERYAEPASSFAYMLGANYDKGFLNYAWKLLMQNHPHDSICGCSIDQVHKEMMPRFDQVDQVAEELTTRALTAVANRIKTEGESLMVFNPLNWSRTDKVRATIDFPVSAVVRGNPTFDRSMDTRSIRLHDSEGKEIPFALISSKIVNKAVLNPIELPLNVMVRRFIVEFVAQDVPSCGYRAYKIEKAGSKPAYDESLAREVYWDNAIGNEFLRLAAAGGSLVLERLNQTEEGYLGDTFGNINTFEDVGDVGDEYNFQKPVDDLVVTSLDANPKISLIDRNPVSATYKMDMNLTLPASASADFSSRSDVNVECPVTTYLTLTRGVPRLDIVTTIDNRAKDHRLRVLFPSGITANSSVAEGQFDAVERTIGVPVEWGERASTFNPQQSWADVSDGDRGLCMINKGLPEYEVYSDEGGTMALTLLRCTGTLSGGGDGPGIKTPEAQCLGRYTFEYALYPHDGNWEDARVWMQAHQHNVPMIPLQTGAHDGDLPSDYSFVETSHPELIVSAIKKAEDSEMLVVRFYNPTSEAIENGWVKVQGAKSAKLLNLNEEAIGDVEFADGAASVTVEPKKIVTVGFEV